MAWQLFSGTTQRQRLGFINDREASVRRHLDGGEIDAVTAQLRLDMLSMQHEDESHLGHP